MEDFYENVLNDAQRTEDEAGSELENREDDSASEYETSSEESELDTDKEEEPEEGMYHYERRDLWTEDVPPAFPPAAEYDEVPGLRAGAWSSRPYQHPESFHPSEFFHLFWPPEWYDKLAKHTNSYARELVASGALGTRTWTDTTREEMMAFHGLLIFMSIQKNSDGVQTYWRKDHWGTPHVAQTMKWWRFKLLKRCFHVARKEQRDYDPAHGGEPTDKVKRWYERSNVRTNEIWQATETVCIDESMTRGASRRNPIRQVVKGKPIPCGSKTWSMVDQAGVEVASYVYKGKREGVAAVGLSTEVVTNLVSSLWSKGHVVIADNFYGNFNTFQAIKIAGHRAVLMLKTPKPSQGEREPSSIVQQMVNHMQGSNRGERYALYFQRQHPCMLIVWHDAKMVSMLTDVYDAEHDDGVTVRRRSRQEGIVEIDSSLVIKTYNRLKSLVDEYNDRRSDGDLTYTTFRRWWLRVFINGPLMRAENNAWATRRYITGDGLSFREFRRMVSDYLIKRYLDTRRPIDPRTTCLTDGHGLDKCRHAGTCVVCRSRNKTRYYCTKCRVAVHQSCHGHHKILRRTHTI